MFYLLRNNQIAAAETFDRAAALVAQGWELTTRAHYMATWRERDEERLRELHDAARCAPLAERTVGE